MEIQKIFSEIDTEEKLYSVLMTEEELSLFSEVKKEKKDKEKDDTKLKLSDRLSVLEYKLRGQSGRDNIRAILDGDTKKVLKHDMKDAAKLAGAEALLGAGLGAYVAKDYGKKAMLKTAGGLGAVGAGLGATMGVAAAAGGQLGMKAGLKLREKNKDLDKTYKENKERRLDEMKIAEGKMTKAEYAKKWYKD